MKNKITARWNQNSGGRRWVEVLRGDLHIANVVETPTGWQTMYLGTGRRNGRKRYGYPSEAIHAFFGVNLQIKSEPEDKRTVEVATL
jgi:hypothetical protein